MGIRRAFGKTGRSDSPLRIHLWEISDLQADEFRGIAVTFLVFFGIVRGWQGRFLKIINPSELAEVGLSFLKICPSNFYRGV